MKTIEEIIDETNNCDFSEMGDPFYDYEQVLEIAKKYAMQEVLKHLEIAANKAKTEKHSNSGSWLDASINKESITNIQINLT